MATITQETIHTVSVDMTPMEAAVVVEALHSHKFRQRRLSITPSTMRTAKTINRLLEALDQ